jgi:hypothetical protein
VKHEVVYIHWSEARDPPLLICHLLPHYTIFTDLCQKADILKQEFSQAYSTILRGLVLNYYYINLKSNPLGVPFDKLCEAIRNYFEGLEYKRDIFTQWNALKLRTVIDKNIKKSTIECL